MRLCPLLEGAWMPAGDLAHGREDLRLVQLAVGEEAEERVDVLGGHGAAHLGPGVGVRLCLEPQVASQHPGQDADTVGWQQRLRAAQAIVATLVHAGEGRAHDVPGGRLRSPTTPSTPAGSADRSASRRISARTRSPAPASSRTSSPPTLPLAPVTRNILGPASNSWSG